MDNHCSHFLKTHSRKASNEGLRFSNGSIMSLVNQFVKAVGSMEETVLVPSRLMDAPIQSQKDPNPAGSLLPLHPQQMPKWAGKSHADLFNFFTAIKEVHNTLMWGGRGSKHGDQKEKQQGRLGRSRYSNSVPTLCVSAPSPAGSVSGSSSTIGDDMVGSTTPPRTGITRQPSSASLVSSVAEDVASNASGIEDDAEISSTDESSDSGLDQDRAQDTLRNMADKFSGHLQGLLDCLEEFTAVANVVSQRYQEEVGGTS